MNAGSSRILDSGRVAALGFAGGLRSQMPLALLSLAATRNRRDDSGFLGKRGVAAVLCLMALGEIAGDKVPGIPSRLEPRSLGGRLTLGALAGTLLCRRQGSPAVLGTVLGATGALAGSYAGFHARAFLVRSTGIPDPAWAVGEDAAAVGTGLLATRHLA